MAHNRHRRKGHRPGEASAPDTAAREAVRNSETGPPMPPWLQYLSQMWVRFEPSQRLRRVRTFRIDERLLSCLGDDEVVPGAAIPSRLVVGETHCEELPSHRRHTPFGYLETRLLIHMVVEFYAIGTTFPTAAAPCGERELELTYLVRHWGPHDAELRYAVTGSCGATLTRLDAYDGAELECHLQLEVTTEPGPGAPHPGRAEHHRR